jgi:hypothetical protein
LAHRAIIRRQHHNIRRFAAPHAGPPISHGRLVRYDGRTWGSGEATKAGGSLTVASTLIEKTDRFEATAA